LDLPIRFRLSGRGRQESQGTGRVVDISSQGLAFRSGAELATGMSIQAFVSWPVTLGDECLLQLFLEGTIQRVACALAVIRVRRYEFRTGGRIGTQGRPEAEALVKQFGGFLGAATAAERPATRF
jgi:hypothetical protein